MDHIITERNYSYPSFIKVEVELVRGCKNIQCNTRFKCKAYGIEQKVMSLTSAQTVIDHLENDDDIKHILLFGIGDSSNYLYAAELKFKQNTKCSVSIVYPFLDEFPDHLNRMYRVNTLTDVELLSDRIRHPNVVHFIMSRDTLNSSIEMIQKLKKIKEKINFRLAIKSYNYYDSLGENYVDYNIVHKLLRSSNIEFEKVCMHYTSNTEVFVSYDGSDHTIGDYKVTTIEDLIRQRYIINKDSPLPLSQWALNLI